MRLGDFDALKADFDSIANKSATGDWQSIPIKHIKQIIDNAPTVEAIPTELHEKIMDKVEGELLECQSNLRPQGEWIDYDNTFYKCPECGYLLEKDCPYCHNKIVLPRGDKE